MCINRMTCPLPQNININVDLTCAITNFDIVPKFLDYTIEVFAPSNNGHEPPILLARRELEPGALSDSFTVPVRL